MELVTDPNAIAHLNFMRQQAAQNGRAVGNAGYVPGVDTPDAGFTGPDLLRHFDQTDPVTASSIRSLQAGGMPGTGRNLQHVMQMATLASSPDDPFDATVYEGRKKMRDQLALASPQSLGGQRRNGTAAMEHLATAAEAAANLNNSGGWGIAPLAHAINAARGLGTEQAGKMDALSGASQHYGQEITKFYAGSPGGEAERERFIKGFGGAKSPTELAQVLEMEATMIPAKMDQINEDVQTTMGKHADPLHANYAARQQSARDKFNVAIAKLRGQPGQPSIGSGQPGGQAAGATVPPMSAPGPNGGMPGAQSVPTASQPTTRYHEGQTAVNRSGGPRLIFKQGQWVPAQ
jgi:hypothetical protein